MHHSLAISIEDISTEGIKRHLFDCLRLGFESIHITLNDLQISQSSDINAQNAQYYEA